MRPPSNKGDRIALGAVCGLLLILAALVAAICLNEAEAQAVGGVGRVGRFMSPNSPADGGGGVPSDAIATEDDEGLLTEADEFLITEN